MYHVASLLLLGSQPFSVLALRDPRAGLNKFLWVDFGFVNLREPDNKLTGLVSATNPQNGTGRSGTEYRHQACVTIVAHSPGMPAGGFCKLPQS
jgi:hypothetical protein